MMTGSIGWRCLICFSSAEPSMPGMRISDNNTSGVLGAMASSTSLPLSNVVQCKPAPVSARSSTQRMELSSSTIQTIPRCIRTSLANRQVNREFGMTWPTVKFNFTRMLVNQTACDGEAQTCTPFAATDHGVKKSILQMCRYAGAVIFNIYPGRQTITHAVQGNLKSSARAQCNRSAFLTQSLQGITGDVE